MNIEQPAPTRRYEPKAATGELARRYCGKDLPLQVLQSRAGYYIGTFDEEAGPCSRESVEYWRDEEEAKRALVDGTWTQKEEP